MRSKRQVVIFVHGLRGDSHGLLDIANELPQDRYEAITLDLPGYGDNPALDNSTTDSYADWLHKFRPRYVFYVRFYYYICLSFKISRRYIIKSCLFVANFSLWTKTAQKQDYLCIDNGGTKTTCFEIEI